MLQLIKSLLSLITSKSSSASNDKFFLALYKQFPHLVESQKQGNAFILKASEGLLTNQRAYLLATAWHETAYTMQPITEYGGKTYFNKYDTGRLAKILGNTPQADGDGHLYRGRGYVQLTGRANYIRASKALGVDFLGKPDLALDPTYAAKILVRGCSEGWFTSKKLGDYLTTTRTDYLNARRIVNGTDKASQIASYAKRFELALLEA